MDHQMHSIFDVDNFSNLVKELKIAQCMKSEVHNDQEDKESSEPVSKRLEDLFVSDKLFCSFCNVEFENNTQQRLHYKLDWHRYNLKLSLKGRLPVNEEEFQRLAGDVSSISGSESDSEDTENEENVLRSDVTLEREQKISTSQKVQIERHSKVFFENADGKILSVYRCILHDKKTVPVNDNDLVTSVLQCVDKPNWAIIMLGGGHFAAAIFNGKEPIVHKSFHSYTVRSRQGGTQSSRDGRSGGSHPKSAGASLRRYNEASFNQHVQDILTEWKNHLQACSLILCRAVGHNRNLLFGGRNAPLIKTDPRLRTIPFSTRRATFKEVQRVHSILSALEIYGPAKDFQTSFPITPKKSKSKMYLKEEDEKVQQTDSTEETVSSKLEEKVPEVKEERETRNSRSPHQKKAIDRAKSRPSPHRPLPEIVTEILAQSSPEISDMDEGDIKWMESEHKILVESDLKEFHDTIPPRIKEKKIKKQRGQAKKKKHTSSDGIQKEESSEAVKILRQKLLAACKMGNITLLQKCLRNESNVVVECLDEKEENEKEIATQDEIYKCLNEHVTDNSDTLLHIVAEKGNTDMVRCLLEAGCDPSLKNKKSQPPFAVSADRETRNTFRKFMSEFPDKYDYRKSQIPGPLTDEMERELAEKQKELKRAKRMRDRERKKEETDKDRFLKLSDREKRALAAERRILESNAQGRSNIKVVTRCFECAVDITGKVPFEYDIHRFCTIECLKKHRQKLKLQKI